MRDAGNEKVFFFIIGVIIFLGIAFMTKRAIDESTIRNGMQELAQKSITLEKDMTSRIKGLTAKATYIPGESQDVVVVEWQDRELREVNVHVMKNLGRSAVGLTKEFAKGAVDGILNK